MSGDLEELITYLKKTNEQQEARIKEQEVTIAELRITISDLRGTIANLNETLDEFRRKFFGTSSEKTPVPPTSDDVQDPQEAEVLDTTIVKEHTRTRKPKTIRKDLYAMLPVREVMCDLPESQRFCPDCDTPLEHLGYKFVREELRDTGKGGAGSLCSGNTCLPWMPRGG